MKLFGKKSKQKYYSIMFIPMVDNGEKFIGLMEKIIPCKCKEDAYTYAHEFLEKEFYACTVDFEIVVEEANNHIIAGL